ncbi:MAG: 50S ribosomal protein L23 [archaeon]
MPTFENKFNPYHIVEAPLATEKCIRLIEFDNILVFLVNPRATKREVKRAVEELFKVKVSSVNIQNSVKGKKKAYVKLDPNYSASDVSADLGFI